MTEKIEIINLFKKYFRRLCNFAYVITKDQMLSEDAVQQVFLNLLENCHLMENIDSINSYLYISTKNNAINLLNQRKTRSKYEMSYFDNNKIDEVAKPALNQFSKLLREAISSLPGQCRVIYELKHIEGLTYKEIANYLEISQKTVENQIGIAFKKLRTKLLPYKNEIYN